MVSIQRRSICHTGDCDDARLTYEFFLSPFAPPFSWGLNPPAGEPGMPICQYGLPAPPPPCCCSYGLNGGAPTPSPLPPPIDPRLVDWGDP